MWRDQHDDTKEHACLCPEQTTCALTTISAVAVATLAWTGVADQALAQATRPSARGLAEATIEVRHVVRVENIPRHTHANESVIQPHAWHHRGHPFVFFMSFRFAELPYYPPPPPPHCPPPTWNKWRQEKIEMPIWCKEHAKKEIASHRWWGWTEASNERAGWNKAEQRRSRQYGRI